MKKYKITVGYKDTGLAYTTKDQAFSEALKGIAYIEALREYRFFIEPSAAQIEIVNDNPNPFMAVIFSANLFLEHMDDEERDLLDAWVNYYKAFFNSYGPSIEPKNSMVATYIWNAKIAKYRPKRKLTLAQLKGLEPIPED